MDLNFSIRDFLETWDWKSDKDKIILQKNALQELWFVLPENFWVKNDYLNWNEI